MAIDHGGKRSGAGRKHKLPYMDRLYVGARAENLAQKYAKRAAFAKLDARLEKHGVRNAQEWLRDGLLTLGSGWYERSEGAGEKRDDIDSGVAALKGNTKDPEIFARVVRVNFTRHGMREPVLKIISRWATWRYKVEVTPRYVRSCWTFYNDFLLET